MKHLLFFSILVASACTSGGESIFIVVNGEPDDNCATQADEKTFLVSGTLDTDLSEGYVVRPVVKNFAVSTGTTPQEIFNRTAFLKRANVTIDLPAGFLTEAETTAIADFLQYSVPLSAPVGPDGSLVGVPLVAIRQPVLDVVGGKLDSETEIITTVRLQFVADIGGNEVETNNFEFPITTCKGCLKVDVGQCALLPTTYEPANGDVCVQGQDTILECCTEQGAEICPAVSTASGD